MNKRIVFLGSGGGGNLKFIYYYLKEKEGANVVGVATDRICGAFYFATQVGLPVKELKFNRNGNNKEVIEYLNQFNPDIIVTNIHKILGKDIVETFNGKLINLHYSYLPAFGGMIGMKPVDKAIERNNRFIGTTCHYVNENVDDGKTISQGIFNVGKIKDVYQATFECGALTLLNGIFTLTGNNKTEEIIIKDYIISPGTSLIDINLCEQIFNRLKNENPV